MINLYLTTLKRPFIFWTWLIRNYPGIQTIPALNKDVRRMANIVKNFNNPEETRKPADNVEANIVDLGVGKAAKFTAQPGWKWSKHIKPVVGTEWCEASHLGTVLSGRMMVVDKDGGEQEVKAGDVYSFGPGHDGWVIGDEPMVALEFDTTTAENYGKS